MGTQVSMPGINYAASFHVNALAPTGFRVIDAKMAVSEPDRRNASGRVEARGLSWLVFDDDLLPSAGHVVWSNEVHGQERELAASFSMSLYANKAGLWSECVAASVLSTVLLAAFDVHLARQHFQVRAFDTVSAAALLLTVPAAIVAIATIRDDHRIASRSFALTRMSLAVLAAAMAAAAVPFAFELQPRDAEHVWYCAAFTAWVASAKLTLSCAIHYWRISRTSQAGRAWRRRVNRLRRQYAEQANKESEQ